MFIVNFIEAIYSILWGDLITFHLGGNTIGLSLLVILLIPTGIFFTIHTGFIQIRAFPKMCRVSMETARKSEDGALSGLQSLMVSTATRVGMGNLVGVVAAISAGGAGAIFWMWLMAIIGSATAYVEGTLAQLYKEKDPLYGGFRGGPAYYLHALAEERSGKKKKKSILAMGFAISGLICWCGISQVISNSVASSFENAFQIKPLYTTVLLVIFSACIILKKNATVKVLDVMVPLMAGLYLFLTFFVMFKNINLMPEVFGKIFSEAFGVRQAAAGGFGAALMNGVKRGLFSNEAGSGSAPCAAAAADVDRPETSGLIQTFGVFVDTILICSCTAFILLLAPEKVTEGLSGMTLLQAAMKWHFGDFGVIFVAVILWLFSFSTFIGILYYARSNVAYLLGDNWWSQTLYKVICLVMLFIGGLAAYTFVWDLGDVGIGLMTLFNLIALYLMSGKVCGRLKKDPA